MEAEKYVRNINCCPIIRKDLEFEFITTQRLYNSLLYVSFHPKVIDMKREKYDSYLRMKQSIDAKITKMLHVLN